MNLRAMLRDWRGFLACFRIRCPTCGRFYYVPSELASIGERQCRCEEERAAEGNVNWPLAYQHLWDRYLVLSEALDAERERARVLTEALEWYGDYRHWKPIISAETSVAGLRLVASGCLADRDVGNRARAALATAGGEGATT